MKFYDFVVKSIGQLRTSVDPPYIPALEEERLKAIRAHQQAGREWHSAWQKVLYCCKDCTSLERLAPEIRHQSQEFADLPEVMQAMQQLWQQRWQELTQATA